jgi:hypothetical protein
MKKRYYVIWINCDCASDWWARSSPVRGNGPRCPNCQRYLGFMEWRDYGSVLAESEGEAIKAAQARYAIRAIRRVTP